ARVHGGEGRLGIPYDHLALRVRAVDGSEWLADVGFGAHSLHPLAFGERGEQQDPAGVFRIVEAGPDLDVVMNGAPQYRLELRPRELGDFVAGAWWHSTSPASHFVRSLVCSRVTEDGGRITLSGRTFKVTSAGGAREQRELGTDEEVLAVYREEFGIDLRRVPTVRKSQQG
ncbi:arylamine N-acetyltransferase, partial [Streptomyces griseorubiginosus]|uniref:arylamine N-acetyltransferase n=1 Tax=Streptomyces griseorubiginosus TaxID=67304 RepID=UPI001AD7607C